ncbi:nuclear transport factor 2 family protein [Muriicola sp. Z0-33]|uniref:nuclear transport factor 2 family protein n=1 Tax=Muriicola sp. Z0-33 TaxID=2816957 RepID=UPI002237EEA7|nr:nuclear transport factor 2 family protein [Muriicola sp. Z0-33]MCW5517632.1 nuclear transport factor 2 family protein [Muriicola sp. Z0-33]
MNKKVFLIVLHIMTAVSLSSQQNCLSTERLLAMDAAWEKALLTSDTQQLNSMLAEDFIWVHNHASLTDSKAMLLQRASDPKIGATGKTRSRVQRDVSVIIKGATGVVTGTTVVDRGPSPTTYHFMRTYVENNGNCLLLANHTMAVPDKGE